MDQRDNDDSDSDAGSSSSPLPRQRRSGRFIKTLRTITEETPPGVARWNEDGSEYDVVDAVEFEQVLRAHFPNAAPKTFFRQLSHYGIRKVNVLSGGGGAGKTPGSFSLRHAKLLRDDPARMNEIRCRHRKRPGRAAAAAARRQPSPQPPPPLQPQPQLPPPPPPRAATMTTRGGAREEPQKVRVDEYVALCELERNVVDFRERMLTLLAVADSLNARLGLQQPPRRR